jgi:hypothetical protein
MMQRAPQNGEGYHATLPGLGNNLEAEVVSYYFV